MTFASASQFHIYLLCLNSVLNVKHESIESGSSRFQPREGPLRDYTASDFAKVRFQALLDTDTG